MKFTGFLISLMLVSPAWAKSFFFPHYARRGPSKTGHGCTRSPSVIGTS
jgi:hypothetical protein